MSSSDGWGFIRTGSDGHQYVFYRHSILTVLLALFCEEPWIKIHGLHAPIPTLVSTVVAKDGVIKNIESRCRARGQLYTCDINTLSRVHWDPHVSTPTEGSGSRFVPIHSVDYGCLAYSYGVQRLHPIGFCSNNLDLLFRDWSMV